MTETDQLDLPNQPGGSVLDDAAPGASLAGDADHVGDLGAPSFWMLVILFFPICGVAFVPAVGLFLLGLSIKPPEGSIDFHVISLSIQIIAGLLAMVVPHELLHGFAARLFGHLPWSQIRFGFYKKLLAPSCTITGRITIGIWRWILLTPMLVTALVVGTILVVFPRPLWLLFFTISAGLSAGDLAMALSTVRYKTTDVLVSDKDDPRPTVPVYRVK